MERVTVKTFSLTQIAVLVALGVVLPALFHVLGIAGNVFLPMHFPALLGGFLLPNVGSAFLLGAVLPLLNFLLLGMPAFPIFLPMMVELGSYGALVALFHHRMQSFAALFMALLLGRGVYLGASWFILGVLLGRQFSFYLSLQNLFVTALPGMVLQLMLIPLIVKRMKGDTGKHFHR